MLSCIFLRQWDDVSPTLLIQLKCLARMTYSVALNFVNEETVDYLWEWSFIAEIYSLTQKRGGEKKGGGAGKKWHGGMGSSSLFSPES